MKKISKILIAVSLLAVMTFGMTVMTMAEEKTITPTVSVNGNETSTTETYTYSNAATYKLENLKGYYGIVIPVNVSQAGTLEFKYDVVKLDKSCDIDLYTDSKCTNRVSSSSNYITSGKSQETKYIPLSNGGTYYLRLRSYGATVDTADVTNTFKISAKLYSKADREIKSGQTITYYRNSGDDNFYFKYKANATGAVKLEFTYSFGSYVTITDAKKKEISEKGYVSSTLSGNSIILAVKKNATYYFKINSIGVTGSTSAGIGNLQTIKATQIKIKAKGGAKKSKAANIKYNKTVKGVIVPGDKKAKWYKISLKKGKKPAFVINGNITGSLNISVYTKKGKKISSNIFSARKGKYNTYGTWKKGTYYIKVVRANSLSSGTFSIKNVQAKQ